MFLLYHNFGYDMREKIDFRFVNLDVQNKIESGSDFDPFNKRIQVRALSKSEFVTKLGWIKYIRLDHDFDNIPIYNQFLKFVPLYHKFINLCSLLMFYFNFNFLFRDGVPHGFFREFGPRSKGFSILRLGQTFSCP